MSYQSRPIKVPFYRIFFVVILFSVAFICLSQVMMDFFFDYNMLSAITSVPDDAVRMGLIICGVLSMGYGIIMMSLLKDRRVTSVERRQRQMPIDFEDRRSGIDRRSGLPFNYS